FKIIGMLPYIHAQDGCSLYFGYIHQWVVLVRRGAYFELTVFQDQPGPAATETSDAGGIQFFFKGIEASESAVDIIGQFTGRSSSCLGSQDFPEETVIPMS